MSLIDVEIHLVTGRWVRGAADADELQLGKDPLMWVLVEGQDCQFNRDRVRVHVSQSNRRFQAVPQDTEWGIWDTEVQAWADTAAGTIAIAFPTQAIAQDVARLLNAVTDQ